jgi:hypothetical protein
MVAWIAGGVLAGGAPELSGLEDAEAVGVAGGGFVMESSIRAFLGRSLNEMTTQNLGQNPVCIEISKVGSRKSLTF